jgi:hypothetical protein
MDGLTERMVYIRKSYKILIGKSEGERPLEKYGQGGRKNPVFILRITERISFH